ncbi:MAG: hypothetical protein ABFD49_05325 [Armatimonadota bacterium]|nr:hypothetical protein [bacterium]
MNMKQKLTVRGMSENEYIEEAMRVQGISRSKARFQFSIASGQIDGDVVGLEETEEDRRTMEELWKRPGNYKPPR